ncbi:hypothetical protein LEMLEM_LOCUS6105 [Lemmus lemmus]
MYPGLLGERAASEAESCVLGSTGGKECRAAVQLFHLCKPNAVVSPKSWGPPHQPVLQSFWNKAEWKTEVHDSHSGTPQLFVHFLLSDHRLRHLFLCYDPQCSPHTCSQYTNLQLDGCGPGVPCHNSSEFHQRSFV